MHAGAQKLKVLRVALLSASFDPAAWHDYVGSKKTLEHSGANTVGIMFWRSAVNRQL